MYPQGRNVLKSDGDIFNKLFHLESKPKVKRRQFISLMFMHFSHLENTISSTKSEDLGALHPV